jgi:hypothetical protein
MTPDELRTIGEEIHGHRWQTALARDLDQDGSTVRRWLSAARRIPPPAERAIRLVLYLHRTGQHETALRQIRGAD